MKIEDKITINKFGQNLITVEQVTEKFNLYNILQKKSFLVDLLYLILQSKPREEDIELSIIESKLKPTFTPCVLLKKGISEQNLRQIINLPNNEESKIILLLLSLFKVSYRRCFLTEKNHPNKWWYWDLSNSTNVNVIIQMHSK